MAFYFAPSILGRPLQYPIRQFQSVLLIQSISFLSPVRLPFIDFLRKQSYLDS